jgi:hypothetical protein
LIQRFIVLALLLGIAVPALAADPPTIDDLDGAKFIVRAKGVEYDLAGQKFKSDGDIEWTITKTGVDTVSFDIVFGGMSATAFYKGGFLLQATTTPEDPPQSGSSMYLAASGKPGKLKLKGALTVYAAGPGVNALRIFKLTAKQVP